MFGPACTVSVPLRLSTSTDTSILQCLVVTVTAVSGAPKASWAVMYTMNNHTYNAMRESDWSRAQTPSSRGLVTRLESDNRLAKPCIKVV